MSKLAPEGLALARLIPKGEKGAIIRRLVAKLLLSRCQDEIVGKLTPEQVGVGVNRGAESVIHRLRGWTARAPPDHMLI